MYTQNVSIPPDYFTWRSTVPSQFNSVLDCHESNLEGQQTGMLLSQIIYTIQNETQVLYEVYKERLSAR